MITFTDTAGWLRKSSSWAISFGCSLMVLVLVLATPQASTAHPFHVSFAEVDWNAAAGTLEVALKIDPDDLEREVRLHCGQRITLEDQQATPLVAAYIRDHFSISERDTPLETAAATFKWVGSEITPKSAWLFFEIKSPDGPDGLVVHNRLLAHADQPNNTVLVRTNKGSLTLSFGRRQTQRTIRVMNEEGLNHRGTERTEPR